MIRFWRFLRLSHLEKRLFLKALFWLTYAKLTIKFCSFERLKPHLGQISENSDSALSDSDLSGARYVKQAVGRADKCLPFHCQCLVMAICAGYLLKEQRVPYRLFLGVKKESQSLAAHAWVKVGEYFITGQSQEKYTTVKVFK